MKRPSYKQLWEDERAWRQTAEDDRDSYARILDDVCLTPEMRGQREGMVTALAAVFCAGIGGGTTLVRLYAEREDARSRMSKLDTEGSPGEYHLARRDWHTASIKLEIAMAELAKIKEGKS
jgi:hypothetical protein